MGSGVIAFVLHWDLAEKKNSPIQLGEGRLRVGIGECDHVNLNMGVI